MLEDNLKKPPAATPEIARLMGLNSSDKEEGLDVPEISQEEIGAGSAPINLPFGNESHVVTKTLEHPHAHLEPQGEEELDMVYEGVDLKKPAGVNFIFNFLQASAPFLAVFIVGIVLYLFFFTSFS